MKAAIIICLILSMITFSYTNSWGEEHKFDLRLLFSIAALVMFIIRG